MTFAIRVKWYCHFDDDVYVNVEGLSKLLSQYDSSMPYYIGRNPRGPYGMKVHMCIMICYKELYRKCNDYM